jgi:xanthine dehydrogenase accessory factor
MQQSHSLDEFFAHAVERRVPLVLATVVSTIGSTYRKPGAQMLIAGDGRSAGLLSGGCLESDLLERSRSVLETGRAIAIDYDSRGPDDVLWGIGLGCEGAMRIVLTRLGPENEYAPYAYAARCRAMDRSGAIALVIDSDNETYRLGNSYTHDEAGRLPKDVQVALDRLASSASGGKVEFSHVDSERARFLVAQVALPTRLLVLGAGPDAAPLVEMAGLLDWHVTVLDHRPAYAIAERFPRAKRVGLRPAATLNDELDEARYDAAVVMSHHLPSDEQYLRVLAKSDVPYVGLLGPAPRRERLMHALGADAPALEGRLYGPIGLDIGASTPESIALSIVAEIQAVQTGRAGRSYSLTAGQQVMSIARESDIEEDSRGARQARKGEKQKTRPVEDARSIQAGPLLPSRQRSE